MKRENLINIIIYEVAHKGRSMFFFFSNQDRCLKVCHLAPFVCTLSVEWFMMEEAHGRSNSSYTVNVSTNFGVTK